MSKKDPKFKVVYRPLSSLKQLENNPRYIKKEDFERLCASVQNNPELFEAQPIILSNRTGENVIIAGNQRYKAAIEVGLKEVPTILLEGLTEAKEREIVIRTNITNGRWDWDILSSEIWGSTQELADWGVDVGSFLDDEPEQEDAMPELPELDEEKVVKPMSAKITFTDEEMLKKFQNEYESILSDELGCIISYSGGKL
jgi:hypothetical protein